MKKGILITIVTIIIAVVIVFVTDIHYWIFYYTSNVERFNNGDKLYLKKKFLDSDFDIKTDRGVRPLTKDEYEITHYMYTTEEADAKYKKLVFQHDFLLINSYQLIDKAKLKQLGSAYIGVYRGVHLMKFQDPSTGAVFKHFAYEISTNKAIIDNKDSIATKPENYTWADDKLYIEPTLVDKQ